MLRRFFETKYRVDKAKCSVVVKKNIVSVLSYICYEQVFVPKSIAAFLSQADFGEMLCYLTVARPHIGADCILSIDNAGFIYALSYSDKIKFAIRE